MKSPSLLVLAAGLGSRYQGLKQIDGMGPGGTSLLEYGIYDALEAGFKKFIFVIRPEMVQGFKQDMTRVLEARAQVHFVVQETRDLPGDYQAKSRLKPWGTAHAVYAARHVIHEAFGVINGDDYYGPGAYKSLFDHLLASEDHAMVAYGLDQTLSKFGGVARGICTSKEGYLKAVEEVTGIEKTKMGPYTNDQNKALKDQDLVSMNLWGFVGDIGKDLEDYIRDFLDQSPTEAQECYLPAFVQDCIDKKRAKVRVLTSQDQWFGVTYAEDKAWVTASLEDRVEKGLYPRVLWMGQDLCTHFSFKGDFVSCKPYGDGHIHKTYKVHYDLRGQDCFYILQEINTKVFKDVPKLMHNIEHVTEYLQDKAPEVTNLSLVRTKEGKAYLHQDCAYYRAYDFVTDSQAFTYTEDLNVLYESGRALGRFQDKLKDFPVDDLYETIVDFHDTPKRYRAFEAAAKADVLKCKAPLEACLDFVRQRSKTMDKIVAAGLPLRVSHNDTKLNNILMDIDTLEGKCVIDLDTVMPGQYLYDFGDALRSCGSSHGEDDPHIEAVHFDMKRFEAFSQGYMTYGKTLLSEGEIALMADAVILMTLECGMRFLTDHLQGDVYFKTAYRGHNLLRARNQFALVKSMEKHKDEMTVVIQSSIGRSL